MRSACRQDAHLVVRQIHATLALGAPWEVAELADVACRIAAKPAIIDGDIEDAGEHSERAQHDLSPRREGCLSRFVALVVCLCERPQR